MKCQHLSGELFLYCQCKSTKWLIGKKGRNPQTFSQDHVTRLLVCTCWSRLNQVCCMNRILSSLLSDHLNGSIPWRAKGDWFMRTFVFLSKLIQCLSLIIRLPSSQKHQCHVVMQQQSNRVQKSAHHIMLGEIFYLNSFKMPMI